MKSYSLPLVMVLLGAVLAFAAVSGTDQVLDGEGPYHLKKLFTVEDCTQYRWHDYSDKYFMLCTKGTMALGEALYYIPNSAQSETKGKKPGAAAWRASLHKGGE